MKTQIPEKTISYEKKFEVYIFTLYFRKLWKQNFKPPPWLIGEILVLGGFPKTKTPETHFPSRKTGKFYAGKFPFRYHRLCSRSRNLSKMWDLQTKMWDLLVSKRQSLEEKLREYIAHWANLAGHVGFWWSYQWLHLLTEEIFSFSDLESDSETLGIAIFKVPTNLDNNFERFSLKCSNSVSFWATKKWAVYQNGVEFHQKSL